MRQGTIPAPLRLVSLLTGLVGCVHAPPQVDGMAGAPNSPSELWVPPPAARATDTLPRAVVPSDLAERIRALTLRDVIDVALRNNAVTRASWAETRAAADLLGSARGRTMPTV